VCPTHLNTRGGGAHASSCCRAAAAGEAGNKELIIIMLLSLSLLAAHADGAANTHKTHKRHRQKTRLSGSRLIRRKRGAHVGLVGGVGARPVREVGNEEDSSCGRVAAVGVEEDSGGQALAPRDGGAEVLVGVVADFVEAIAHEVGVGLDRLDGVAAGEVDCAVDVGSEGSGGVECCCDDCAAVGEALRLMPSSARLRSAGQVWLLIFWVALCVSSRAARPAAPRMWVCCGRVRVARRAMVVVAG
jgi:hypothetical protein